MGRIGKVESRGNDIRVSVILQSFINDREVWQIARSRRIGPQTRARAASTLAISTAARRSI